MDFTQLSSPSSPTLFFITSHIAGERRFRAAKILGWKDIRAEVCPMDDLEAEEKSVVENVHRGDLKGPELEDIVDDLWEKGNPKTGSGRYTDIVSLSKRLGWADERARTVISAKKARERLDLKSFMGGKQKVTTGDLVHTMGMENDSERKRLLEKKVKGDIGAMELPIYAQAVKDSPKAVKEAILDKPQTFTPKVAEEKSVVENVHRGDLKGQELEDIVYDLWQKGKETGRYSGASGEQSMEILSKRLGWERGRASEIIRAKEARERLGFKVVADSKQKVTTDDLIKTRGIENDADRKTLISRKDYWTLHDHLHHLHHSLILPTSHHFTIHRTT